MLLTTFISFLIIEVRAHLFTLSGLRMRLPGQCHLGDFDCGLGECIPVTSFHNGQPDCKDGSDEWCFFGQIKCGSKCVNFLDNNACWKKYEDKSINCHIVNPFPCKGYGQIVPFSSLMNAVFDCIDKSDEDAEYVRTLESSFRCWYSKTNANSPSRIVPVMDSNFIDLLGGKGSSINGESPKNQNTSMRSNTGIPLASIREGEGLTQSKLVSFAIRPIQKNGNNTIFTTEDHHRSLNLENQERNPSKTFLIPGTNNLPPPLPSFTLYKPAEKNISTTNIGVFASVPKNLMKNNSFFINPNSSSIAQTQVSSHVNDIWVFSKNLISDASSMKPRTMATFHIKQELPTQTNIPKVPFRNFKPNISSLSQQPFIDDSEYESTLFFPKHINSKNKSDNEQNEGKSTKFYPFSFLPTSVPFNTTENSKKFTIHTELLTTAVTNHIEMPDSRARFSKISSEAVTIKDVTPLSNKITAQISETNNRKAINVELSRKNLMKSVIPDEETTTRQTKKIMALSTPSTILSIGNNKKIFTTDENVIQTIVKMNAEISSTAPAVLAPRIDFIANVPNEGAHHISGNRSYEEKCSERISQYLNSLPNIPICKFNNSYSVPSKHAYFKLYIDNICGLRNNFSEAQSNMLIVYQLHQYNISTCFDDESANRILLQCVNCNFEEKLFNNDFNHIKLRAESIVFNNCDTVHVHYNRECTSCNLDPNGTVCFCENSCTESHLFYVLVLLAIALAFVFCCCLFKLLCISFDKIKSYLKSLFQQIKTFFEKKRKTSKYGTKKESISQETRNLSISEAVPLTNTRKIGTIPRKHAIINDTTDDQLMSPVPKISVIAHSVAEERIHSDYIDNQLIQENKPCVLDNNQNHREKCAIDMIEADTSKENANMGLANKSVTEKQSFMSTEIIQNNVEEEQTVIKDQMSFKSIPEEETIPPTNIPPTNIPPTNIPPTNIPPTTLIDKAVEGYSLIKESNAKTIWEAFKECGPSEVRKSESSESTLDQILRLKQPDLTEKWCRKNTFSHGKLQSELLGNINIKNTTFAEEKPSTENISKKENQIIDHNLNESVADEHLESIDRNALLALCENSILLENPLVKSEIICFRKHSKSVPNIRETKWQHSIFRSVDSSRLQENKKNKHSEVMGDPIFSLYDKHNLSRSVKVDTSRSDNKLSLNEFIDDPKLPYNFTEHTKFCNDINIDTEQCSSTRIREHNIKFLPTGVKSTKKNESFRNDEQKEENDSQKDDECKLREKMSTNYRINLSPKHKLPRGSYGSLVEMKCTKVQGNSNFFKPKTRGSNRSSPPDHRIKTSSGNGFRFSKRKNNIKQEPSLKLDKCMTAPSSHRLADGTFLSSSPCSIIDSYDCHKNTTAPTYIESRRLRRNSQVKKMHRTKEELWWDG